MAPVHDLGLEKLDVKIFFLHDNLDTGIYITQLEGFVEEKKEDLICQLTKSSYALK